MCFLGYFLSPLFRFAKKGKLPFEPYTPTPANEIDHMMNNKWMEYLAGFRPDVRIRDLVIPATHDVGTYALSNKTPFVFSARTQRVSIYQQLCAGSRSMDLRYGGNGNNADEVYIYHGPYRSLKLEEALIQIGNFVSQNTKEFVLVSLQEEQSVNDAQKQYMITLVQKYLTPYAVTSSDTWFSPSTATLGQMNHNKKNLFVVVDDDFFMLNQSKQGVDTFDYEAIGVFQSSQYYQSAWIDTNKVPDLFQGDLTALAKWTQMPNTFYATQMILTLQTTKKDILAYAFGEESLRVDHQTKDLQKNQAMPYFYLSNSQLPFNFVELDYIDYNPNLVKFLIGLNFPHKLSILQATLDGKDFTLQFNQQVKRAGALFIPDFKQSFNLPAVPKQLEITFLFEGDTQPVSRSLTLKDIDNQFVLTYLDISEPVKPKSNPPVEQDLDVSTSRALTYA